MSVRDQSIVERVARAEKDLLDFKSAQTFGKDVTKPKVIERFNSDGTPTEWDVIGDAVVLGPFLDYYVDGLVTYTARNQTSPWASVYAKVRINPGDEIVSFSSVGVSIFPDLDDVFSGEKTIRFGVSGTSSASFGPPSDATVDRLWIKFYILATDYGEMKLEFPFGVNGHGTVVDLT